VLFTSQTLVVTGDIWMDGTSYY